MTIDRMRKSYTMHGLDASEVASQPVEQFREWFGEAQQSDLPDWMEINAMTLSTCSTNGRVTSRIVLLKGIEPLGNGPADQSLLEKGTSDSSSGFVFYTNYESVKGKQIAENPRASLCFFWPHLERQVRIEGTISKVSRQRSEAYFHSRPRDSQLGAWVSDQSLPIADRSVLADRFTELRQQHAGQPIPLPDHWGGYEVSPEHVEFWQGRPNRLHDRIGYTRAADGWSIERLSP